MLNFNHYTISKEVKRGIKRWIVNDSNGEIGHITARDSFFNIDFSIFDTHIRVSRYNRFSKLYKIYNGITEIGMIKILNGFRFDLFLHEYGANPSMTSIISVDFKTNKVTKFGEEIAMMSKIETVFSTYFGIAINDKENTQLIIILMMIAELFHNEIKKEDEFAVRY